MVWVAPGSAQGLLYQKAKCASLGKESSVHHCLYLAHLESSQMRKRQRVLAFNLVSVVFLASSTP